MYTNISACISFTSTLLIVDPTAEEEDLATGTVTIVTDEEGRLCSVHKPGTSKFTTKKLMGDDDVRSRKDSVPALLCEMQVLLYGNSVCLNSHLLPALERVLRWWVA